jgi:hypothetical protein
LLTRSGKPMPVLCSLTPLHDQDKIVGAVVTMRAQAAVPQPTSS